MKTKTISSRQLDRDITYHIIPPVSDSRSVNILYVQDGNDYLELGAFQENFQLLVHNHSSFKEWMVVLVHPGTSEERWHAYHIKGEYFQNYIAFMYKELMPTIEKGFTVNKRAVLRDSLAANISLHLAARKPTMWSHLLLQSAAITDTDIAFIKSVKSPVSWHVYQAVGIYEDDFISPITNEQLHIYTRNKELRDVFQEKGVELQFMEHEDSHLWVYWKRILPDVLYSLHL